MDFQLELVDDLEWCNDYEFNYGSTCAVGAGLSDVCRSDRVCAYLGNNHDSVNNNNLTYMSNLNSFNMSYTESASYAECYNDTKVSYADNDHMSIDNCAFNANLCRLQSPCLSDHSAPLGNQSAIFELNSTMVTSSHNGDLVEWEGFFYDTEAPFAFNETLDGEMEDFLSECKLSQPHSEQATNTDCMVYNNSNKVASINFTESYEKCTLPNVNHNELYAITCLDNSVLIKEAFDSVVDGHDVLRGRSPPSLYGTQDDAPGKVDTTSSCDCRGGCNYTKLGLNIDTFKFGFIPRSILVPSPLGRTDHNFDTLQLNSILRESSIQNWRGLRLPLSTSLNITHWRYLLADYWDTQICEFLEFGFPLDLSVSSLESKSVSNHPSASAFPTHIEHYLRTETQLGAIKGPFVTSPLQALHCSPMMTRPKPNSENRRVIVDLSWPISKSVNYHVSDTTYCGTNFQLKLPTIDDILEKIVQLNGKCLLFKVDLQRAFRQLRTDPKDIHFTGLNWHKKFYIDVAIPFGYRHGSMACQRVTDAIRFIMHQQGHSLFNYIDDLIGCKTPDQAWQAYKFLCDLLEKLGMPISKDKLCEPQTEIPCLGINVNVTTGIISIPDEKLVEVTELCKKWQSKVKTTKRQLQSLAGVLLYIHKCVKPARIFINRILDALRQAPTVGYTPVSQATKQDIEWFVLFLKKFNGKVIFNKSNKANPIVIHLDASLKGMGACMMNRIYACPMPEYLVVDPKMLIVHLEMLNILIALRRWAPFLQGNAVMIHCDNMAVVTVIKNGRTRDMFLAAVARNIWLLTATHDIDLTVLHIPGKNNVIADLLSRWFIPGTKRENLKTLITNPVWDNISVSDCMVNYKI